MLIITAIQHCNTGEKWRMDSGSNWDKLEKAVALRYDIEQDAAPVVVAKGRGLIAERIKELAEENGIPVKEDHQLADYLMALDLYQEIPAELYPVVAEILAFIYSMDRRYQ